MTPASAEQSAPETGRARRVLAALDPRLLALLAAAGAGTVGVAVAQQGVLVLLVFAGALLAVASFMRPSVGLLLFAAMLYARASENLTASVGLPSIAPLFAAFLLTALVARQGIGALWRSRMVYWTALGAWGVVLLMSVLVAVNPDAALASVTDYLRELVFMFVIVLYARSIGDLRALTWGLLLGGLVPSLITIVQAVSGTDFQFWGFGQTVAQIVVPGEIETVARPGGHVGDGNFFALALIPLVPLGLHRARWETSRGMRQLAILVTLAITIATVLTYSRGGYLTLVAVVLALAVAGFVRWRWLLVAALAVAVALPLLPDSYAQRAGSIVDVVGSVLSGDGGEETASADTSIEGRRSEVLAGLYMFSEHPLIGVGARNYPEYYQEYARPLGIERRTDRSAHSLYVEIAAETGLLGLAAFGGLMASLFLWARRVWMTRSQPAELRDLARVLAVALFGYLLASIFLHAAYPRFLWMIVAAILATADVAYERRTGRSIAWFAPVRRAGPALVIGPRERHRVRLWLGGTATVIVIVGLVLATPVALGIGGFGGFAGGADPAPPGGLRALAPTPTPAVEPTPTVVPLPTPTPVAEDELARLRAALVPEAPIAGCDWHPETRHSICGTFLEFWSTEGGLPIFGHPLSAPFSDAGRVVQYFERVRLEQLADGTIEIAPLGARALVTRQGTTLMPSASPRDDVDCVYEDATGHNVCGRFAYFWVSWGGERIFGLPISEGIGEDGVTMQYFERARLEYRPGFAPERFDIVVGRLGAEELARLLAAETTDGAGE